MAEANWPRHVLSIGWTQYRRTLRALRKDAARLVLLGVAVLGSGLAAVAFGVVFAMGLVNLTGTPPIPDSITGSATLFWLFGVFIVGQRAMGQHDRIDAEPLMLTTVSPRTLAGGMVLAELFRALSYLLLPIVAITIVVAYGFQSPVSLLLVPFALLTLFASTVVTGYLLGLTAAYLVARYRFVAQHKTALGLVIVAFGMGPYFVLQSGFVDGLGPGLLAGVPIGWMVHVGALGTQMDTSLGLAAGGLFTMVLLLGGGSVLLVRAATAYWFTDPVDLDASEAPDPTPVDGTFDGDALGRTLGRFDLPAWVSRPSHAVARKALVRTRRNPNRLSFILLPAVIGATQAATLAVNGGSRIFLVVFATVGAAWSGGAMFGLNPLGDEGNVLPATLTSGMRPRAFVNGILYPGVLVGVPLAIVAPVATGLFAGTPLLTIAGLVGLSLALTVFAIPFATALGMYFPRFSAFRTGGSREVIPPTLMTTALYSIPVAVLGLLGAAALLLADDVAAFLDGAVSTAALLAVGFGGPLVVSLLGGWVAYRAAVSRFADYRVA